jgi:glycosyltransferase involved in cell wall biosynthesis
MIIHLTTVHPRDDSRIRSKEVASVAKAFRSVGLYVQDRQGHEIDSQFSYAITDTGPRLPRLSRMTLGGWRMFRAVLAARPKVAHFHDPELLPWAILLKLAGIKIVYDVHEDMPEQVKHNPGLPRWAQRLLPPFVAFAEWVAGKIFDGFAVPTQTIADRFPRKKTVLVRNFPILDELHVPNAAPMDQRPPHFAYVGYISEVRNIFGMMNAVSRLQNEAARLRLVGSFAISQTEGRARSMKEWHSSVIFEGWASRERVGQILGEVRAGLVVLKPVEHEMLTLPIKLFEYMAAGLPVIASDFPLWRSIVEGANCGLLVDPLEPASIATAMQWVLDHPDEALEMGRRGRRAVETDFNWEPEAERLIDFYRNHLGVGPQPSAA